MKDIIQTLITNMKDELSELSEPKLTEEKLRWSLWIMRRLISHPEPYKALAKEFMKLNERSDHTII